MREYLPLDSAVTTSTSSKAAVDRRQFQRLLEEQEHRKLLQLDVIEERARARYPSPERGKSKERASSHHRSRSRSSSPFNSARRKRRSSMSIPPPPSRASEITGAKTSKHQKLIVAVHNATGIHSSHRYRPVYVMLRSGDTEGRTTSRLRGAVTSWEEQFEFSIEQDDHQATAAPLEFYVVHPVDDDNPKPVLLGGNVVTGLKPHSDDGKVQSIPILPRSDLKTKLKTGTAPPHHRFLGTMRISWRFVSAKSGSSANEAEDATCDESAILTSPHQLPPTQNVTDSIDKSVPQSDMLANHTVLSVIVGRGVELPPSTQRLRLKQLHIVVANNNLEAVTDPFHVDSERFPDDAPIAAVWNQEMRFVDVPDEDDRVFEVLLAEGASTMLARGEVHMRKDVGHAVVTLRDERDRVAGQVFLSWTLSRPPAPPQQLESNNESAQNDNANETKEPIEPVAEENIDQDHDEESKPSEQAPIAEEEEDFKEADQSKRTSTNESSELRLDTTTGSSDDGTNLPLQSTVEVQRELAALWSRKEVAAKQVAKYASLIQSMLRGMHSTGAIERARECERDRLRKEKAANVARLLERRKKEKEAKEEVAEEQQQQQQEEPTAHEEHHDVVNNDSFRSVAVSPPLLFSVTPQSNGTHSNSGQNSRATPEEHSFAEGQFSATSAAEVESPADQDDVELRSTGNATDTMAPTSPMEALSSTVVGLFTSDEQQEGASSSGAEVSETETEDEDALKFKARVNEELQPVKLRFFRGQIPPSSNDDSPHAGDDDDGRLAPFINAPITAWEQEQFLNDIKAGGSSALQGYTERAKALLMQEIDVTIPPQPNPAPKVINPHDTWFPPGSAKSTELHRADFRLRKQWDQLDDRVKSSPQRMRRSAASRSVSPMCRGISRSTSVTWVDGATHSSQWRPGWNSALASTPRFD